MVEKEVMIQTVDEEKNKLEITLDSGAGASCWPVGLLPELPMKPRQKGVRFRAANGAELEYHGRKDVGFQTPGGGGGRCNMEFHVTNTTKPLASALAVVKAGNRVVLSQQGSYIENEKTRQRIRLQERGGTYVFEVTADPATTEEDEWKTVGKNGRAVPASSFTRQG